MNGIISDPADPDILVPFREDLQEVKNRADMASKKASMSYLLGGGGGGRTCLIQLVRACSFSLVNVEN